MEPKDIGEVTSTKTTFTWKIENFSSYLSVERVTFRSEIFCVNGLEWCLGLLITESKLFCLCLKLTSPEKSVQTNASISILNKQGRKCYQRITGIQEYVNDHMSTNDLHGIVFISNEDLIDKKDVFLPNDELTILYELFPGEFNIQNETWFDFEDVLVGKNFSDFKLIVKGQHLYSHKLVLSRKSQVFAAMFEHNVVENTTNSVIIEDVEYDVVVEMLRFMYTGEVKNIEKVVENLLIAADKYALLDLKDICENHLISTITQENAIQYLDFAIRHNCSRLKDCAKSFIINNAHQMTQLTEFKSILDLQDDILLDIICKLSEKAGSKSKHRLRL